MSGIIIPELAPCSGRYPLEGGEEYELNGVKHPRQVNWKGHVDWMNYRRTDESGEARMTFRERILGNSRAQID
jgi:hypothetical protein